MYFTFSYAVPSCIVFSSASVFAFSHKFREQGDTQDTAYIHFHCLEIIFLLLLLGHIFVSLLKFVNDSPVRYRRELGQTERRLLKNMYNLSGIMLLRIIIPFFVVLLEYDENRRQNAE